MANLLKIESVLERQARFWELRERLANEGGEAARKAMVHLDEGPWLTVSRQLGSLGTEIGRNVSGALGWQMFDREIVTGIAEHTHAQEAILSQLDERAIDPMNDYIRQLFDPKVPGRVPVLQGMVKVIWGLAKKGNAVVLGRGANWFLDARFGLRVRVVAPLEKRAERVAEREGLDRPTAEARVVEYDRSQADWIQHTYGHAIDDPIGYDLVINTGWINADTAAQACLAALKSKLGAE